MAPGGRRYPSVVGRDIPLGRIAGVKVGFSWSVILIAGLYTVTLATNRFPDRGTRALRIRSTGSPEWSVRCCSSRRCWPTRSATPWSPGTKVCRSPASASGCSVA